MAVVSSVVNSLLSTPDNQGQVQGTNLMRAETAAAAGNPASSRRDSVTIGADSSSSANASYKGTAAANKASADSSRASKASESKSGQQQELQALSTVIRMQRAYASSSPTTDSGLRNSFRDLFQVRQAASAEFSQGAKLGASMLSQGSVNASPAAAVNVATNPTASSMLLSQQPQLTGVGQAVADKKDVERKVEVSSVGRVAL